MLRLHAAPAAAVRRARRAHAPRAASPTAQLPSPAQAPATCSSLHGSASGGISPPQPRVSMHCMTCMHVPALQSESLPHSAVGAQ